MSESKAILRERLEYAEEAVKAERDWRRDEQKQHKEEIAELEAQYAAKIALSARTYLELAKAVVNVYGISVDTLLKAHQYKLKQAHEGELQDAYTEAINGPEPKVSDKPKGEN